MTTVREKHARKRVDVCRIASLAADAAGHLYRLTKLKAQDSIVSIKLMNDADAGFTDMNIGIWTPSSTTDDPVVVDADGLVDGYDATLAQLTPVEILGTGTGAGDPENFGLGLWAYCPGGPASDPGDIQYEIVMQAVGNPAGSADVAIIIEYTAGD
jgi:hypothetical protein